jgi:hypothetical protein
MPLPTRRIVPPTHIPPVLSCFTSLKIWPSMRPRTKFRTRPSSKCLDQTKPNGPEYHSGVSLWLRGCRAGDTGLERLIQGFGDANAVKVILMNDIDGTSGHQYGLAGAINFT